MNEQVSWIFYRYAIGGGTLLLGIAAIIVAIKVWQMEAHLNDINFHLSHLGDEANGRLDKRIY